MEALLLQTKKTHAYFLKTQAKAQECQQQGQLQLSQGQPGKPRLSQPTNPDLLNPSPTCLNFLKLCLSLTF